MPPFCPTPEGMLHHFSTNTDTIYNIVVPIRVIRVTDCSTKLLRIGLDESFPLPNSRSFHKNCGNPFQLWKRTFQTFQLLFIFKKWKVGKYASLGQLNLRTPRL